MANNRRERLALVMVIAAVAFILVAIVLTTVAVGIMYGIEKALAMLVIFSIMLAVVCLAGASKTLREGERNDG